MPKNNKKIIWLSLIILFFFFLIFVFTKDTKQNINISPTSLPILNQTEKTAQAFLEINGQKLETTIKEKESVYDFMLRLKEEDKINFKDKTYTGIGKFIYEINGTKNEDKNWIYYVNGEKANIGISNYKINPGDVVSWKYEDNY